jgi:hypothetical protein
VKIWTFFLKNSIIFTLKLLVNQYNTCINIFSIKWIKYFLLLKAIMSGKIKRNKWILLYFFILLHYIEFLFNNTFINRSVTFILSILRIYSINIFILLIALRDVINIVVLISLLTEKFITLVIEESFLWAHLQTCLVKRYTYFL